MFLRRLADGEVVSDDTPIFMALADNIGYDATGRKTFKVAVEREIAGVSKVERHRCDLFDYRVTYGMETGRRRGRRLERTASGDHSRHGAGGAVAGVSA